MWVKVDLFALLHEHNQDLFPLPDVIMQIQIVPEWYVNFIYGIFEVFLRAYGSSEDQ